MVSIAIVRIKFVNVGTHLEQSLEHSKYQVIAIVCTVITGGGSSSSSSILCHQPKGFQHCYLSLTYIEFRVSSSDPHFKSV